ncbi:hypothetical protein PHYC_01621 [Phycisphaerales bacterium]|nr:hypothetical protein PHYC_01621 [Phycisphaerales bacterium]
MAKAKRKSKPKKKVVLTGEKMIAARLLALRAESRRSQASRNENIFANTADARIKGHALGAHRAAQAKRDGQQRKSRGGTP